MTVFRSEVLLDVVLAAAAILLILLMLVKTGSVQTHYFRQSTVAIGCFAGPDGAPWSGGYAIYARNPEAEGDDPWRYSQAARDMAGLRRAIKRAIRPDDGYSRVAILIDFSGSTCAPEGGKAGRILDTALRSIPSLPGFEGWTIDTELVPCRDRAHCESLLRLRTAEAAR